MRINTVRMVEITNKEQELITDILELCDDDEDISTFIWNVYNCAETVKLQSADETLSIKYIEEETSTEEEKSGKKKKEKIKNEKIEKLLYKINEAMHCWDCPFDNEENYEDCEDHCVNIFLDYVRKYDFKFKE